MTRFCGDAIGVRSGGSGALTTKDLRKNMQKFIQTGVHPDVQRAQEQARASQLPALPDHDPNREFVFLEIKHGNTVLGRLVIELFSDHVAVGAMHLRQRCQPGSKTGLKGAVVSKLQSHYGLWLGKNPAASEGLHIQPHNRLRHVEAGAVSISLNGDEVAISLGRALVLDETHQVVGRVHRGKEVLDKLNDAATDHMDVPLRKITVSLCGQTNAAGSYEELQGSGEGGGTKDPLERLAQQSQGARDSVLQALAVGLGQKRKGGAESESTAGDQKPDGAAGSKAAVAGPPAPGRNVKAKFMDSMLGDLSDGSSDDEEDKADQE